jgi:hypothetical protein
VSRRVDTTPVCLGLVAVAALILGRLAAVINVMARFGLDRYRRSVIHDPRLVDPIRQPPPSE